MQDTVDQALLQPFANVGGAEGSHNLLDRLDRHLPIRFALVLQVGHDPLEDLTHTDLLANVDRGLDHLPVVSFVECHATDPEALEELVQDVLLQVASRDAVGGGALRDDLQDNLLHFFVGGGELAQQNLHDLAGVVVRVVLIHQGDDVANSLEEAGQALAPLLARAGPQRVEDVVEALDTVRVRCLGQRSNGQTGHGPHLGLLVVQVGPNAVNKLLEMGQDCAAHQDGNLLHNLDAGVAGLPRLLAAADSPEEGKEGGDAQSRGNDGESSGGGVSHVLVHVVDVGPHDADHGREARGFGKVGDDFASLNPRIVVLVNEQRLDDDKDLVDVGPDHVVQLVQDAVDDLDEQMALLVLERLLHEKRENLVEQGPSAEVARVICELSERSLPHRRSAILDLQQQAHDLPLLELLDAEIILIGAVCQLPKVGHIFGLEKLQVANARDLLGHLLAGDAPAVGVLHHEPRGWCGCRHQLVGGSAYWSVARRGLQDLVTRLWAG